MQDIVGLGKITEEALGLLKQPVQTLMGPAWGELAGTLGDSVRHWRDMRRLEHALSAVKMIRAKGLDPKTVDPAILFPILDAASLVTDASLKERWDALLANAGDPGNAVLVLPAFAAVLSELSPTEALILDKLAAQDTDLLNDEPSADNDMKLHITVTLDANDLQHELTLSHDQFLVMIDNLARLRLCEVGSYQRRGKEDVRLTDFGRALIRSCRY